MSEQALFASTVLHCRNPRLSESATFATLMDAINAVVAPMSFTHSFTATTRGGFGRGTPLSDSKQILPKLYRHTTETLYLTSQNPDVPVRTDWYASVDLERAPEPVEGHLGDRPLRALRFNRTLRSSEARDFITALERVFSIVDASSGHIHVTSEWTLAVSESGFQAVSPARPEPPSRADGTLEPDVAQAWLTWKHEEDTNDRVHALAEVRSTVGPRLRGTYWGTFLGREMVDELGGAERITRDAPVHRVEPFDDGALYLQLTAEPEPITTPTMQAGLLALEQLLKPVLVPLPPYWATRAANRAKK